jgi:hypothetical protein
MKQLVSSHRKSVAIRYPCRSDVIWHRASVGSPSSADEDVLSQAIVSVIYAAWTGCRPLVKCCCREILVCPLTRARMQPVLAGFKSVAIFLFVRGLASV